MYRRSHPSEQFEAKERKKKNDDHVGPTFHSTPNCKGVFAHIGRNFLIAILHLWKPEKVSSIHIN